jgi:hypothetical protein
MHIFDNLYPSSWPFVHFGQSTYNTKACIQLCQTMQSIFRAITFNKQHGHNVIILQITSIQKFK